MALQHITRLKVTPNMADPISLTENLTVALKQIVLEIQNWHLKS